MTTAYELFLPEVLAHIRDCPQEYAVSAIRNTCIQFCDETHWLTYQPDAVTLIANEDTYDVEFESGVEPLRLIWAKVEGASASATMTNDNELVLATAPTQRIFGGLTMKIAVRPTRASTTVDDSVFNRWHDGIVAGARARLQETPGQPYSDPDRAAWNWKMFRDAVNNAKMDRQRELTVGPLQVQMRRF